MRRAVRPLMLAGVWLLGACSDLDEVEPVDVVVRSDSAGVALVSLSASAFERLPLVLLEEPVLVLGSESGPPEAYLGRVADATRLGRGQTAVADALSRRILVFSESGTLEGVIGAPGQGPGEFESVSRVAALGDTLLVLDARAWKITAFGADGNVYREIRVSPHTEFAEKVFGRPGRDQLFVSWARADRSPGRGTTTGPLGDSLATVLDRVHLSGSDRVDSLRATGLGYVIFSQAEYDRLAESSSVRFAIAGSLPLPFENRVLVDALPDEVLVAQSGRGEIRRFDSHGDLVQVIRVDANPRPGAGYSIDVLSDWYVSSLSDRTLHHIARRLVVEMGKPRTLAHFSDVRGGADGALWLNVDVGPSRGEEAEWHDWVRLDRNGTPSLTLRVPAALQILEFGTGHVVGVHRDAMEVETVRVHRFHSVEGAG